jgi:hypothetical protein
MQEEVLSPNRNSSFKLFALKDIVEDKNHIGIFDHPSGLQDIIELIKRATAKNNIRYDTEISIHIQFSLKMLKSCLMQIPSIADAD